MAITLAISPSSARPLEPITITVAGASASTAYVLTSGTTKVSTHEFTTDGSGGATVKHVHDGYSAGTLTFSLRPKTEFTGQTTAAATASMTVTN